MPSTPPDTTLDTTRAFVYSGPHYGRQHTVLGRTGNYVTVRYEPTAEMLVVPACDVEILDSVVKDSSTTRPGSAHCLHYTKSLSKAEVMRALLNIGLGAKLVNECLVELGYALTPFPTAPNAVRSTTPGGEA